MTGALIKLLSKIGHRIPELLGRAAMGDPVAIATLAALGIITVGAGIENKR